MSAIAPSGSASIGTPACGNLPAHLEAVVGQSALGPASHSLLRSLSIPVWKWRQATLGAPAEGEGGCRAAGLREVALLIAQLLAAKPQPGNTVQVDVVTHSCVTWSPQHPCHAVHTLPSLAASQGQSLERACGPEDARPTCCHAAHSWLGRGGTQPRAAPVS